ncbi:MAG: hypothetical protein IKP60_12890 [Treponema sp.]|nr:hypothetical protein [Treponema sp.]
MSSGKNHVSISMLFDGDGKGNYTVEGIANKILKDLNYEDSLKNGIKQEVTVNGEYNCFVVEDAATVNGSVMKGEVLGKLSEEYGGYTTFFTKGRKENVAATVSGRFEYEFESFDKKSQNGQSYVLNLSRFSKGSNIVIGRIYLPEYDFFCKYRDKIENLITKHRSAKEIEDQQKEDDKKRAADRLLANQEKSLEDIEELLEYLDDILAKGNLPEHATLREIKDELKILDEQKDNLIDVKSIKDYRCHFENTYYQSKRNLNLDSQIEGEMLDILKSFFEILGDSEKSINDKLDEIKANGDDKKFDVEFVKYIKQIDESVNKFQSKFIKEKEIDVKQLGEIENFANLFSAQKNRIKQKELLKRCKDTVESVFNEYVKQENKSTLIEESMQRTMRSLYEIFGKSEQEINQIFKNYQEAEMDREFEIELNEKVIKINDAIIKIQNSIANTEAIDFSCLHILEESLASLLEKKNRIKNIKYFDELKTKVETIYTDYQKQNSILESVLISICSILDRLYDILGYTDEQKQKILESRQKADEKRLFEKQIAEQAMLIQNLTSKIRELEIIVGNREQVKPEILQDIEDLTKKLVSQIDTIQDKSEIEHNKIIFDAAFRDCKKLKTLLSTAELRMQNISKDFSKICEKSKKKVPRS